ncbi:MAG TPA: SGNH/GDSL hydrolase family protein [Candidatus Dormibacteraeota bacterium]|jgi:lysophospholipase L1-like esterase
MAIHYLALGDSYTIGTGTSTESRNFPGHLARKLEEVTGHRVQLRNPAVDGYTTLDLIRTELGEVDRFRPDLVTILIGANDIVQGVDEVTYRSRIAEIYGKVKALALPPGRVVTLSIPDFSIVPMAPTFGEPLQIRARIDRFNQAAREEASSHGFDYLDLSDLSRSGAARAGWVAADGLHPGDAQYEAWSQLIWKAVAERWTVQSTE